MRICFFALLTLPIYAQEVAIRGYDAVAFFSESKAVKGVDSVFYDYAGLRWYFVSTRHRDDFAAKPQQYIPQFDGYCAYAAGNNYLYEGDPEAWTIVDGKLYFNYSRKVRERWLADRDKLIEAGHRNWPSLKKE